MSQSISVQSDHSMSSYRPVTLAMLLLSEMYVISLQRYVPIEHPSDVLHPPLRTDRSMSLAQRRGDFHISVLRTLN